MSKKVFIVLNLFIVNCGGEDFSHCVEYKDILQNYQIMMSSYETCITKSAEQKAQIRNFENTITSGLQHQIDGFRRDYSENVIKINTQVATAKIQNDLVAIAARQSELRNSQSSMENQLNSKISQSKFHELEAKIKSFENIPSADEYNELKNRMEDLDKRVFI